MGLGVRVCSQYRGGGREGTREGKEDGCHEGAEQAAAPEEGEQQRACNRSGRRLQPWVFEALAARSGVQG